MFAILGSGFGLYGYLPALVDGCGQRIVLPKRYRAPFDKRTELERFAVAIQWVQDEAAALDCADGVVIAQQPADQVNWIHQCLARPNVERLLLEKPLAPSPDIATKILDDLTNSGKVFRIGYIFRYAAWGRQILQAVAKANSGGPLSIRWCFTAHHFNHDLGNWKRFHSMGGGAIRFYGIHLIAMLAEMGYREVMSSLTFGATTDELEKWVASFCGTGLPECKIEVDTRSLTSKFLLQQKADPRSGGVDTFTVDLGDPFESPTTADRWGPFDRRVPLLSQLCRSLWEEDADAAKRYDATIDLWRRVEERAARNAH